MIDRTFGAWILRVGVALLTVCFVAGSAGASESSSRKAPPKVKQYAKWVEEWKNSPKGPFERIRWFCKDGTVLPPKAYACAKHGGGIQHGELNADAKQVRESGFYIANVLADLKAEDFVGSKARLDDLKQLLLERFLISWDDGWIFRGARSYRGAFQSEDDEAGARGLVLGLWQDPAWRTPARYALYRETVRLLPLQGNENSAALVRGQAKTIAEKDKGFQDLRAKIHGLPDAGDAAAVRAYASKRGKKSLMPEYEELAANIDALYSTEGAADAAVAMSEMVKESSLPNALETLGTRLQSEQDPSMRMALAARLMGLLRKHLASVDDPETALTLVQLSLALEGEIYSVGNGILQRLDSLDRKTRLELLDRGAEALYGSGFIGTRQLIGVKQSLARMQSSETPSLRRYREELRYLSRVSEWSSQWLQFNFGPQVAWLAQLDPLAHLYTQDRLRGSALLFYSRVIDSLVKDSNQLAGIEHQLFDQRLGSGLRALNPGLTRGTLRVAPEGATQEDFDRDGIYILPETTSDLPPVAGILTRGEGSSLSHVQLLARNLGIPNVVVSEALVPVIEERLNTKVVMAVSPNGVIQLVPDSSKWDPVFGTEAQEQNDLVIRPNIEKLELDARNLIPLAELRASDSGRKSGPKGANLGELKHLFGDRVPNGFVIPFGVFRQLLDKPIEPGGPSVWNWMKAEYDRMAKIKDLDKKQEVANVFLKRLRDWVVVTDPGPEFHTELKAELNRVWGGGGVQGVFLRSDTNVEDLAGFVGAGLNLTVPNVIGYDAIFKSVQDVWASPFTERSYKWRQSHMVDPEYVFPAVVVQIGFPSEKSGVMVTTDVDSGDGSWLSIAVNEGVGGAVDGQAAESLRVRRSNGEVRFLAQATATEQVQLNPKGGVVRVPTSGAETLLQPREIKQLVSLAKDVSKRFTSLRDEQGNPTPADIEFAFKDGRLHLLQIRSFVESDQAQGSSYLISLDSGLRQGADVQVPLGQVPSAR